MKINIIIFFTFINIALCYYSLKLTKVSLPNSYNTSSGNDESIKSTSENLDEHDRLPLNDSEFDLLDDSFIITKNINFEYYTAVLYLGSNKQYFRLLLSTIDDHIIISSNKCSSCNVSNEYNPALSNKAKKLDKIKKNESFIYEVFQDSCSINSKAIKNKKIDKKTINISKLNFKAIDFDSSGFLNTKLIDGILGLDYKNDEEISNNNFIRELYNEDYISSPSFSIIITSKNENRLYLGDIMKNKYINNYLNSKVNKGKCKIIENTWKCNLYKIEFNSIKYRNWEHQIVWAHSITLSFNTKEKRLIIPRRYYYLIVVGYKHYYEDGYRGISYNKLCHNFDGIIYCSCHSKDDFGIVTFHFEGNFKLDIDIRDYVEYNNSAFFFKCKTNIFFSRNEFIIGLEGLKNTILSFNMKEKLIKFFQIKKKDNINSLISFILLGIIFISSAIILLYIKLAQ